MRRLALALAAVAALLLGGCGIPDSSDVRVLGDGPSAGPAQGTDAVPPAPVTRSATLDTATFILNYLKAAAGDPDGALERAKDFMDPDEAASFKSQTAGITVIRPIEDPLVNPDNPNVTLRVQQIGTLGDDGQLVPSSDPGTQLLAFTVTQTDKGLFLTKAPPVLLLSDVGLKLYYQQHTIYFWNSDDTGLVPDVRYMPRSVPSVQQPTVILNWLSGGPADWLKPAAHGLPQNTVPADNVPAINNNELQIKLNIQGTWDRAAVDRLRQQLQWSLRPLTPNSLELTIGHQNPVKFSGEHYLDANAASRLLDDPEKFVVYNGVIRRLSESPRAVNAVPVLKPEANKGIQFAAMSSADGQIYAAVVSTTGKEAKNPALRVAAAAPGKEADLHTVGGLSGALGHPAWALTGSSDTSNVVGLVTSKSRLYSFAADGSAAQPVEWQQTGDPGAITAFSVAPDGHRIALVAGGKLYRANLTVGGDGVVLSSPDQIQAPGLRSLSAVAWSGEGWLVVSGVRTDTSRVAIADVSIDGAQLTFRLDDIGNDKVTYLSAYPINPVTHTEVSDAVVAYVARGDAWNAAGYAARIKPSDLAGPANGPSGNAATLTAPFFLD
jgi:hypothetical protein